MSDLILLDYQTKDAARSPEMTYLASTIEAAARRVFGDVQIVRWRPGLPEPELPRGVPALIVGRENVHLGPASLEAMQDAVDPSRGGRADALAVPGRLASFALAAATPLYTLRGFEALEARLLADKVPPGEARRSHLPVALLGAELFDRLAAEHPLEDLLTRADLVAGLGLGEKLAPAGVFHDFVDYYGEVRADILPYIPEGVADVLEVGCARGVTGELLARERGCRVTGVEWNAEVAAEAEARLHKVIVGDIEKLDIAERFDAVVATELFEHLNYPEGFLARMRDLLRPGGRIVLSVPNVGHYAVVEDLLAGRWDYLPIGLLCYTHFRFFTRKTLESWIERVGGFRHHELIPQTTELPDRFAKLSTGFAELPEGFEVDRESLRTKGFYVILEV